MKRMRLFLIIVFVSILLIGLVGRTFGEKINSDKISDKVMEEVQKEDVVPIIVELAKNADEDRISDKYDLEIKGEVEKRNIVSFEATKEEIESLSRESEVKGVYYNFQFSASLQDSVEIINASRSWPVVYSGINLTGKGQTVCVIDSGVDYTHSDLGGCFGSGCKVIDGYDYVNNDANPVDDFGHGTHVAGIVAANGEIKGVAPEANIVALKALDSSGNGDTTALIASIDWCVQNSSIYNISVITMSLGTSTVYSTYCDALIPSLTSAINSAIAKNISVIAASGNSNSTYPRNSSAISLPGCIQNVTAVSAADKDDSISSYGHYSSFVKLFAPGTNINSTKLSGGYQVLSGTSMATPHVAGAIALIKEILNLTSRTKTPLEIESMLNSTGKKIVSPEGINFSRINVHNALVSLNNVAPNVSLRSPANGSSSYLVNQTFECSANGLSMDNFTFYLWNSSSIFNTTFLDIDEDIYLYDINITNMSLDDYTWNCVFTDSQNNIGMSSNYTLHIVELLLETLSPTNGSSYNIGDTIYFKYNVSSNANATLCSLIINGTNVSSQIPIEGIENNISYSLEAGTYSWYISCLDDLINTTNSSLNSLTISVPTETTEVRRTGGGGGGGAAPVNSVVAPKVYSSSEADLKRGFSKNLGKGDLVKFVLYGINHSMNVKDFSSNVVQVVLNSSEVNLVLISGETQKVNLNNGENYDLAVTFNGIVNNQANITLRQINESMPKADDSEKIFHALNNSSTAVQSSTKLDKKYFVYGTIVFGILLIIWILIRFYRRKNTHLRIRKEMFRELQRKRLRN